MRYQLGTPMETCECKCECDGRRSTVVTLWDACWKCGVDWLEGSRKHAPKEKTLELADAEKKFIKRGEN